MNLLFVDAVEKLEEALSVNPKKHDAFWCLGNAHTSNAFLIPDFDEAKVHFEMAAQSFEQAYELVQFVEQGLAIIAFSAFFNLCHC